MRDRIDPETYGGAYLLGVRGISVIAHGNSSRRRSATPCWCAARGAEHGIVDRDGAARSAAPIRDPHLQDGDPANTVTQVRESETGETAT